MNAFVEKMQPKFEISMVGKLALFFLGLQIQ